MNLHVAKLKEFPDPGSDDELKRLDLVIRSAMACVCSQHQFSRDWEILKQAIEEYTGVPWVRWNTR